MNRRHPVAFLFLIACILLPAWSSRTQSMEEEAHRILSRTVRLLDGITTVKLSAESRLVPAGSPDTSTSNFFADVWKTQQRPSGRCVPATCATRR